MNNLEKTSRKITYALFGAQSLFSATLTISFTISSIIAVELADGNNLWAGAPATLVLVGAAAIAYPMGRLMDRWGRRVGLSLGYLLGIASGLISGWAVITQSLPLFLFGALCLGLNRGANDLGRYAAAEATPPGKRARAISLVVLGGTVGAIAGPGIIEWASKVAERAGIPAFSGPWFAASVFLVLSLLVINIFLRPDPQHIAEQFAGLEPAGPPGQDQEKGRPYREIFSNPKTKLAIGAMICGQLTMIMVMVITPVHMHGHQHGLAEISWVIMAHTLGMFGLSFMTGWLVDKLGQVRMILLGGLTLVMACLLAPVWNNVVWLAVALFLLGLGWNFCFVAGSALLAEVLKPNEKGRIQGSTDAIVYATSGIGSTGSGLVFAALGFQLMSWLSILIALIPVILVIFLPILEREFSLEGAA